MAARIASKATSRKRTAAKPKAREPKAKPKRAGRKKVEDPQVRMAALEAECNRLAFELDTARERIKVLEDRETAIIKRIDALSLSLHKLLDE